MIIFVHKQVEQEIRPVRLLVFILLPPTSIIRVSSESIITRQRRLCNINIKQVLMPNFKTKRKTFFYQLPLRGSINRKMKKPPRKSAWY